jgi:hypothetical protein
MTSYPTPEFRRTALAPGILGAIVLLAGLALIGSDAFTWIRFAVSILALIVCVYAVQAKQWWWLLPLVPVVIAWNPVFPFDTRPVQLWFGLQYLAAGVFIAAGIFIRIPNADDRNARRK